MIWWVGYTNPENGFLAQDSKKRQIDGVIYQIKDMSDFVRQMILLLFIKLSVITLEYFYTLQ